MQRRARIAALGLSALLCLAASLCYLLQPDSCAAVTIWPVWAWAVPGLFLVGIGWRRLPNRVVLAVLLMWFLYLALLAEEPRSLMRFRRWPAARWEAARRRGKALRVISLNCGVGNEKAAAEVGRYRPDVLLLQETPTRQQVEALARRLFQEEAGVAWGLGESILVRGSVSPPTGRVPRYPVPR